MENKSSSSWVLFPSTTYPGKFYYFNTCTNEKAWSLTDTQMQTLKNESHIQRVSDKSQSLPDPDTPPTKTSQASSSNAFVNSSKTDDTQNYIPQSKTPRVLNYENCYVTSTMDPNSTTNNPSFCQTPKNPSELSFNNQTPNFGTYPPNFGNQPPNFGIQLPNFINQPPKPITVPNYTTPSTYNLPKPMFGQFVFPKPLLEQPNTIYVLMPMHLPVLGANNTFNEELGNVTSGVMKEVNPWRSETGLGRPEFIASTSEVDRQEGFQHGSQAISAQTQGTEIRTVVPEKPPFFTDTLHNRPQVVNKSVVTKSESILDKCKIDPGRSETISGRPEISAAQSGKSEVYSTSPEVIMGRPDVGLCRPVVSGRTETNLDRSGIGDINTTSNIKEIDMNNLNSNNISVHTSGKSLSDRFNNYKKSFKSNFDSEGKHGFDENIKSNYNLDKNIVISKSDNNFYESPQSDERQANISSTSQEIRTKINDQPRDLRKYQNELSNPKRTDSFGYNNFENNLKSDYFDCKDFEINDSNFEKSKDSENSVKYVHNTVENVYNTWEKVNNTSDNSNYRIDEKTYSNTEIHEYNNKKNVYNVENSVYNRDREDDNYTYNNDENVYNKYNIEEKGYNDEKTIYNIEEKDDNDNYTYNLGEKVYNIENNSYKNKYDNTDFNFEKNTHKHIDCTNFDQTIKSHKTSLENKPLYSDNKVGFPTKEDAMPLEPCDLRLFLLAKRKRSLDLDKDADIAKKSKTSLESIPVEEKKKRVTFHLDQELSDVLSSEDFSQYGDNTQLANAINIQNLKNVSVQNNTSWYLVLDSNTLMDEYEFINNFIKTDSTCRLLIPPVCLSVLKILSSPSDIRRDKQVTAARNCLRRLSMPSQQIVLLPTVSKHVENPIINCCLEQLHKGYHVVLITNDDNLKTEAEYNSIQSYTIDQIKNGGKSKAPITFDIRKIKIAVNNNEKCIYIDEKENMEKNYENPVLITSNNIIHQDSNITLEDNNITCRENVIKTDSYITPGKKNEPQQENKIFLQEINKMNKGSDIFCQRNNKLHENYKTSSENNITLRKNNITSKENNIPVNNKNPQDKVGNPTRRSDKSDITITSSDDISVLIIDDNKQTKEVLVNGTLDKQPSTKDPLAEAVIIEDERQEPLIKDKKGLWSGQVKTNHSNIKNDNTNVKNDRSTTEAVKSDTIDPNNNESCKESALKNDRTSCVPDSNFKSKLRNDSSQKAGNSKLDVDSQGKVSNINLGDFLKRFRVPSENFEKNFLGKEDEWFCMLRQVMEEHLYNFQLKLRSRKTPRNLYDSMQFIKETYEGYSRIENAINKMCILIYGPNMIAKNNQTKPSKNKKNIKNTPKGFLDIIGCGVFLFKILKVHHKELENAEQSLKDLLKRIDSDQEIDVSSLHRQPMRTTDYIDHEKKENFVKKRSDIIQYLKEHFAQWRDYDDSDDIEYDSRIRVVRTYGKNLNNLKLNRGRRMVLAVQRRAGDSHSNTTKNDEPNLINHTNILDTSRTQNAEPNSVKLENLDEVKQKLNFDSDQNEITSRDIKDAEPKIIRNMKMIQKYEDRFQNYQNLNLDDQLSITSENNSLNNETNTVPLSNNDGENVISTTHIDYVSNNDKYIIKSNYFLNTSKDDCMSDTFTDISFIEQNNDKITNNGTNYNDTSNGVRGTDKYNGSNGTNNGVTSNYNGTEGSHVKNDDMTVDSGIEYDGLLAGPILKSVVSQLSKSFEAIEQFLFDIHIRTKSEQIGELAKSEICNKASELISILVVIIDNLNRIVQRESGNCFTNKYLMTKSGQGDLRFANYRQVIKQCLLLAERYRAVLTSVRAQFPGGAAFRAGHLIRIFE